MAISSLTHLCAASAWCANEQHGRDVAKGEQAEARKGAVQIVVTQDISVQVGLEGASVRKWAVSCPPLDVKRDVVDDQGQHDRKT